MRINYPKRIFIHTTDVDYNVIKDQFFGVNRWHKEDFGSYCLSSMGYYGGYTILITNGREYRYREDWEETCAVKGYNVNSLSVAIGFDGDIQMPKPKDVELLKIRIKKWSVKHNISLNDIKFIGPHRLVNPGKTCYGSLLKDDWVVVLMTEIKKDPDALKKKIEIERQRQVLLDTLRALILRLKILVGKYILLINKRNK